MYDDIKDRILNGRLSISCSILYNLFVCYVTEKSKWIRIVKNYCLEKFMLIKSFLDSKLNDELKFENYWML